jgi:ankyrin repeat protein
MDMKNIKNYTDHLRESQEGPEKLGQMLIAKLDIDAPPDIEEVKRLIEAGADLEATDRGWTPLHCAVLRSHIEAIKLLIGAGANVNTGTKIMQRSPLHTAIQTGGLEEALLLIQAGANLDIMDKDGHTPLGITKLKQHTKAAKFLIEKGADPFTAFDSLEEMKGFFGGDIGWVPEEAMQRMKKRDRARGAFGRF